MRKMEGGWGSECRARARVSVTGEALRTAEDMRNHDKRRTLKKFGLVKTHKLTEERGDGGSEEVVMDFHTG